MAEKGGYKSTSILKIFVESSADFVRDDITTLKRVGRDRRFASPG